MCKTPSGYMLGECPRLMWGKFEVGTAKTYKEWNMFLSLSTPQQSLQLANIRGATIMRSEVLSTTCNFGVGMKSAQWEGDFSPLNVLVGVKGSLKNGSNIFLEFQDNGMLAMVMHESPLFIPCQYKKVRIIGYFDAKWYIDPESDKVDLFWKIRVYDNKPLQELQWDPGEFFWKHLFEPLSQATLIPFFQDTVNLDHYILISQKMTRPSAKQHSYAYLMNS